MQTLQEFFKWASTLPVAAKLLITAIAIALCALMIIVLWSGAANGSTRRSGEDDRMWPRDTSLEGLRARLDRISRRNARFLVEIAASGRYGIYCDEIGDHLKMGRTEVMTRAFELNKAGLIDILLLTDSNFQLHRDLAKTLGPDSPKFLISYLGIKPTRKPLSD